MKKGVVVVIAVVVIVLAVILIVSRGDKGPKANAGQSAIPTEAEGTSAEDQAAAAAKEAETANAAIQRQIEEAQRKAGAK
jgi:hypothetical protein